MGRLLRGVAVQLQKGTAMSHNWTVRWKGLIFAGYGVLIALVANKFVFTELH